ncbi:MAG: hypothetical protein A2270_11005 [Elusimicrobia bacterium RIFOXYA12_FULL_51_18]|nr:MAG: hypothetical protein A2270_11005 [Elusimicrobia bacterium RIFOXYA12_FULL_51_18]OGS32308.1 MAG: hypothetical protein A2218_02845 [Elusimicrobia bacterium RIFOXYA2_FULL_53_38]
MPARPISYYNVRKRALATSPLKLSQNAANIYPRLYGTTPPCAKITDTAGRERKTGIIIKGIILF